jgi:lipopolysaccharide biosynthesis glycosyltransferase
MNKVFVGWDPREDIAYQVCKYSITSRSENAIVVPLKQTELRDQGLYTRNVDPMSSTEFTFTRFLVPYLMNYQGWAIFCDCDILFQIDIANLIKFTDSRYAVMVVKHDYNPLEGVKMDGKQQLPYPRKNWSSVILFNCSHPANKKLTPNEINTQSGQYLHRFQWLNDDQIGTIHHEYNWLVGHYTQPQDGIPKIIHYTEGGPWFENYQYCEYGYQWGRELEAYKKSLNTQPPVQPFDYLPPDIHNIFNKILHYRVDSNKEFYGDGNLKNIIEDLKMIDNNKIYAVDGDRNSSDAKGLVYDPYLESFILGSGGQITSYSKVEKSMVPVLFRGITKMKYMRACESIGRDYFYIDTGYFGNLRKKTYHRITKNAMQNIGPIIERPFDRLEAIGWRRKKFRPGTSILLCPPSEKAMECFGINLNSWMEETIASIKKYTDRPIIIRKKSSRKERSTTDTMEMALNNDIHCLVTFNSIAATEALLNGKPAFTLGPNAAHSLSLNDLSKIEDPFIPDTDQLQAWAAHLAYCQFTESEMRDGTAWNILNENSNLLSSNS